VVRDLDNGRLSVSRFAPGEPDQKREINATTLELVQALAGVGGTYPDVVQALLQAKKSGSLASRLEVDAVPKTDRIYQGADEIDEELEESSPKSRRGEEVASKGYQVDGPAPDLYPAHDKPIGDAEKASPPVEDDGLESAPAAPGDAEDPTWPLTRRAGKMMGRLIPAVP